MEDSKQKLTCPATIDEYQLIITGSACLEKALNPNYRFKISAELECYAIEKKDNQDGTFDLKYKSKIISAINVTQGQEKIRGIDKTKKSQKLRGSIYHLGNGVLGVPDDEGFYKEMMDIIIRNLENIYYKYKDK